MQRVRRGEVVMVKVKDEENPSDFLTKHVPVRKLRLSVDYAENARNSVTRRSGALDAPAPEPAGPESAPVPRACAAVAESARDWVLAGRGDKASRKRWSRAG